MNANQSGAAGGALVGAPPLATMLTQHLLRDGEIVILTVKPSLWFVPFTCLRFCAVVLILMIAARLLDDQLPYHTRTYMEAGTVALVGRLVWGFTQWMSRLYILTDYRVVVLSGVFQSEIFDCPLRKIARVRIVQTLKERPIRIGSIEIIPFDDTFPIGVWQMVARPKEVYRAIVSTMNRARQGHCET